MEYSAVYLNENTHFIFLSNTRYAERIFGCFCRVGKNKILRIIFLIAVRIIYFEYPEKNLLTIEVAENLTIDRLSCS